ncbi:MAG TPA: hypothetical protein VF233_12525 [Nitrososphaeraceae archaeon]
MTPISQNTPPPALQEKDEYEEGNMTYRTTEKGLQLLRIYNNINEIAPLSGTRSAVHKMN